MDPRATATDLARRRLAAWALAAALLGCGSVPARVDGSSPDGGTDASPASDAAPPPLPEPWFEDLTRAAGLRFERRAAEGYATMADRIGGGVCALDVDGVAPLDLFFAARPDGAGGARLFVGRAPLDYVDDTAARGLTAPGDALGCLAFDAEGDGDDDLLVTGVGTLALFLNEGGRFVEAAGALGVAPAPRSLYASAAAGDVDGDGDLDLLVAGFIDADVPGLLPDCGGVPCAVQVASYDGIGNLLLRREADGRYTDVTSSLAPALALPEPTLVVAIGDLDDDGRPDLYVGNDAGETFRDRALLVDSAGLFSDSAERLGLAYDSRGHGVDTMGWTSGDVDGDGRMDHAATAFEGFHTPVFLCGPGGLCEDRGPALGTSTLASTFRWGNALVDLDLDGDVDLFEATGHIYTDAEGPRIGFPIQHDQPPNLMLNGGDGTLTRALAPVGDALLDRHPARGIAVLDLDDDGRMDVVLGTSLGAPVLLHNVHPPVGAWLRVVLRGRPPNAGAVGARVEAQQGAHRGVRVRVAGEGYLGSFDPRLSFGLPTADPVDLTVRWPDGAVTRRGGVEPDREIVIDAP